PRASDPRWVRSLDSTTGLRQSRHNRLAYGEPPQTKEGSILKRTPGGAIVIAIVALFVALSGAAVAGTTGLVSGAQIKDHSITFSKLSLSAVARLHGLKGPKGDPGAPGKAGPAGGFDPSKVSYVQGP